jgi:hypothetical protein
VLYGRGLQLGKPGLSSMWPGSSSQEQGGGLRPDSEGLCAGLGLWLIKDCGLDSEGSMKPVKGCE